MFKILFFVAVGGAAVMALLCLTVTAVLLFAVFKEGAAALRAVIQPVPPAPGADPAQDQAVAAPAVAAPTAAEPAPACQECERRRHAVPEEDHYETLPTGEFVRSADYETRADGKRVRKDRWETGIRNIATILTGPRAEFEIDDLVEKVRTLAKVSRADYESGGHGVPGSAPVWGPCPSKCDHGSIVVKGEYTDCPACEGRGHIVLESALVTKDAP